MATSTLKVDEILELMAAGIVVGASGPAKGIRKGYTTTEQRIRNPIFDRTDDLKNALRR